THRHTVTGVPLHRAHQESPREIVVARAQEIEAKLAQRDGIVGTELYRCLRLLASDRHVADLSRHARQIDVRHWIIRIVARGFREFTHRGLALSTLVVVDATLQGVVVATEPPLRVPEQAK